MQPPCMPSLCYTHVHDLLHMQDFWVLMASRVLHFSAITMQMMITYIKQSLLRVELWDL